ncbi:MAG TPA: RNA methyltransferase [Brevundimonas sp.]|uniref:TrmH family RNA methyltransferase n=1 Tax=Brevundimonas sp. TaxID=1871086 RepID=UPI002ED8C5ED
MAVIRIADPDDPRIAGFRNIRERDLTGRDGLFVAEGEVVLNVLLSGQSLCRPKALLLDARRVASLTDLIERAGCAPTYAAEQGVLDAIAGFHLHRGILALGEKPRPRSVADVLAPLGPEAVVVVACGIGNHDNMGGIFRNAAAFGAGAVLLDERCCDPFYRKAIRVSVGAVLRTPMATGLRAGDAIRALQAAGFQVLALTPAGEPLHASKTADRVALVLGSEGPGLPGDILARCRAVGIPMSAGFDSLNVAVASGIALHHVTRPR